jgi:hypothetical protein
MSMSGFLFSEDVITCTGFASVGFKWSSPFTTVGLVVVEGCVLSGEVWEVLRMCGTDGRVWGEEVRMSGVVVREGDTWGCEVLLAAVCLEAAMMVYVELLAAGQVGGCSRALGTSWGGWLARTAGRYIKTMGVCSAAEAGGGERQATFLATGLSSTCLLFLPVISGLLCPTDVCVFSLASNTNTLRGSCPER